MKCNIALRRLVPEDCVHHREVPASGSGFLPIKSDETVLLAHGAKRPKRGKRGWGLANKEAALTKALRKLRAADAD